MEKLLSDAPVNHCLSFEQVGDEVIERYHLKSMIPLRLDPGGYKDERATPPRGRRRRSFDYFLFMFRQLR